MRIIAYIDGFNLYYGCLKHTQFKWLDIYKLCDRLAAEQHGAQSISSLSVKFFTADIKANFSGHGNEASISQQAYHRAISSLYPPPKIEIIKGSYSVENAFFYPYKEPVPPVKKAKVNLNDEKLSVWRLEEKQTDVNIALHLYRDTVESNCDAVMLFTNDTDIAPAVELVQSFNSQINIGVIFPRKEQTVRPVNTQLSKLANWTRDVIKDEDLRYSQMTDLVPTKKKPAIKPNYW